MHPLTLYLCLFYYLVLSRQCVVANLDAHDEKNSALSKRYDIQGFPTLKFFPEGQTEPIDYQGGRSEEDLVKFLNEKCQTQRKVGGGLNEKVSLESCCALCLVPFWYCTFWEIDLHTHHGRFRLHNLSADFCDSSRD